ncbi:MAG: hypothetical protein B7X02_01285 [Rhodospirillales bacterium 12-54-5]|nr:MAG: hypothetical protein B7X02_01285 [Rhodospirillales bacterium 12-54-5]
MVRSRKIGIATKRMARDENDPLPKHLQPQTFPKVLEGLPVAAMQEYITELEAEIAKVRTEIDKRGGVKSAAEALFS